MPRLTKTVSILFLLSAAIGCSTEPGVETPKAENITRAWHLTTCEYQNRATPSEKVDLIALGWVINLYINDNGFFLYSATPPGGEETSLDGSWRVSGEMVVLTPAGAGWDWQFTAQVGEEDMTLEGGSAEYDFNEDGTPEAAIWNMSMHS